MKKEFFFSIFLFLVVTVFFFYPVLKGHIPFPGDSLVGNFAPYNTQAYFGFAPGGVPNKAQGADVIREAYPWKTFVIDQLKKGEIPHWTPYNFSGNPIMANFQSAVFYPGNALFLVLPFMDAWTVLIFSAPFLAGFFTYLFLRELQLGKIASILGGVIFAFSSYMVVWMEYGNITHTYLWLPLALLLTERLTKSFTKKNLFILLVTLFISLTGGYIQGYFYIFVTVAFYFFAKELVNRDVNIKKIAVILFILIAPFFLFLFQILPTLALFKDSSRGGYSLTQIQELLNPIWYTITTLIPNFFGHPASRNHWFDGTYIERVSYFGLIPFILALAAVFSYKKKKEVAIFGIIFVATFFLATDFFINKFFYLLPIPVFSTTVPTRILGLFVFAGSILAAFGLEQFLQKKYHKHFLISLISVGSIILLSFIFVFVGPKLFAQAEWSSQLAIAKRNILLPTFFFGVFVVVYLLHFYGSRLLKKLPHVSVILGVVIIIFTASDLFYFFHKITPFSPREFVYPSTAVMNYLQSNSGLDRHWGYGSGYIGSNFQTVHKTFSPEGEDPLHLRWYTEILASTENGTLPKILPRPDANIAPGYGIGQFEENHYRQKILNLTGVKYVLNKDDSLGNEYRPETATFHDKSYKLIWQKAPWQVYENLNVAPRAFLTTDYLVIKEDKKVLEALYSPTFDERKTIILHEEPGAVKARGEKVKGDVEIVSYTPNKVVITTMSDQKALLFLSDTYSNFWKATVDGKHVPVYKADYAFRAVTVPEGKHTVVFAYDSDDFDKGALYSGIFALFIALLFWKINFKKL